MKKLINKIILLVLVIMTITSCEKDFLNQESPDRLTGNSFWRNETDAKMGLMTVYAMLSPGFWGFTEIQMITENYKSDLNVPGQDAIDNYPEWLAIADFTASSTNERTGLYWRYNYRGAFQASQLIEKVGEMTEDKITANVKNQIVAEAKFLRAYFHYRLLMQWEQIIVMKKMATGEEDLNQPLSTRDEAWAFIEQDLSEAIPYLPLSYDANNVGRITKGAAQSLLGKAYLFQGKWQDASDQLFAVIDSKVYSLVTDYSSMFDNSNRNSTESIFEIQFQTSDGLALGNTMGAFIAPRALGGWHEFSPSVKLLNLYKADGKVSTTGKYDNRLYEVIIFNDPDCDVFGQTYADYWDSNGTAIYFKKGYLPGNLIGEASTSNYMVLRYADVLLMYAEAQNELGNTGVAYTYLNMVRTEHGNMPNRSGNASQFKNYLVHERALEFPLEGQRFPDLYRWGLLEQEMLGNNEKFVGRDDFSVAQHAFFPIPSEEVLTNPLID